MTQFYQPSDFNKDNYSKFINYINEEEELDN